MSAHRASTCKQCKLCDKDVFCYSRHTLGFPGKAKGMMIMMTMMMVVMGIRKISVRWIDGHELV